MPNSLKAAELKKTQKQRFLEAAKDLGGSESAFNAALKRIGKAKLPAKPKKKSKSNVR